MYVYYIHRLTLSTQIAIGCKFMNVKATWGQVKLWQKLAIAAMRLSQDVLSQVFR